MRRVLRSVLLRFVRYVGDIKEIEKKGTLVEFFDLKSNFAMVLFLCAKICTYMQ